MWKREKSESLFKKSMRNNKRTILRSSVLLVALYLIVGCSSINKAYYRYRLMVYKSRIAKQSKNNVYKVLNIYYENERIEVIEAKHFGLKYNIIRFKGDQSREILKGHKYSFELTPLEHVWVTEPFNHKIWFSCYNTDGKLYLLNEPGRQPLLPSVDYKTLKIFCGGCKEKQSRVQYIFYYN